MLVLPGLILCMRNPICNSQKELEYRLKGQVFCNGGSFASAEVKLSLSTALIVSAQTDASGSYVFALNSSLWTTSTPSLNYEAYAVNVNASACSPTGVAFTNQYDELILPRLSKSAEVLVPNWAAAVPQDLGFQFLLSLQDALPPAESLKPT